MNLINLVIGSIQLYTLGKTHYRVLIAWAYTHGPNYVFGDYYNLDNFYPWTSKFYSGF